MTLLTMCQQALREVGDFEVPATIVANTAQTAVKLLAHAQREGRELSRRHKWEELISEKTFAKNTGTDLGDGSTSYALPTDYRHAIAATWFDRGTRAPISGPVTSSEWQMLMAENLTAGYQYYFRIRGGLILAYPNPTGTDKLAFEYVSTHWCKSSGGTGQTAWAADTDVGVLDEELMTMGIVWRFQKETGLPWKADFAAYEGQLRQATARSGSAKVLQFGRSSKAGTNTYQPNTANVRWGSSYIKWGQTL
jgi:hypothetical protein